MTDSLPVLAAKGGAVFAASAAARNALSVRDRNLGNLVLKNKSHQGKTVIDTDPDRELDCNGSGDGADRQAPGPPTVHRCGQYRSRRETWTGDLDGRLA